MESNYTNFTLKAIKRYLIDPARHYFLFGPRGTGKTTWIKAQHPDNDVLRIDLLNPKIARQYNAKPEYLYSTLDAHHDKKIIVIDEVQRVPELLTVVHDVIEEKRSQQFILTGSSARKLKRQGVDLLAGRAIVRHMHPFMASELQSQFNLDRALTIGLLPVVWFDEKPQDVLGAYIDTYLQGEIQAEGLIRNIGAFSRFLETISFSHASLLNTSNIARECEVERKTVAGYISILEDMLLAFQLPVFTKRAQRHLSQHPKFYFFDAGVFRALRPQGPLDRVEEMHGHALEGLIAQHLRAWIDYSNSECRLYFWRTQKGVEVDFIIYGPNTFAAIEVKNSERVHSIDLRNLKTFQEDYPQAKLLLLYRGEERLMINGVLCLPCGEFLKMLTPGKELF